MWATNLRAFVLTRDKGRCVYCGDGGRLELEHVRPKSASGPDLHCNLVAACKRCNRANRAKDGLPVGAWLARETRAAVRGRAPRALSYVQDLVQAR